MNLIKKIVACSLALSVAFSGIYATNTKPKTDEQKSSGISSNAKKGIIGASVGGGLGLLAIIGYCLHNRGSNAPDSSDSTSDSTFKILIIGENSENRQKVLNDLKTPTQRIPNSHQQKLLDIVDLLCGQNRGRNQTKEPQESFPETFFYKPVSADDETAPCFKKTWDIKDCAPNDSNIANHIADAHLIIAIIDKPDSYSNIEQALQSGCVSSKPKHPKRILTLVDTNQPVPFPIKCPTTSRQELTIKDALQVADEFCINPHFLKTEGTLDYLLQDDVYYWDTSLDRTSDSPAFRHYLSPLGAVACAPHPTDEFNAKSTASYIEICLSNKT